MDVVVPVYNAVDDLERCIDSVLALTDFRYRLVLIDDASPDPAVATCFAALARRALPHVVLAAQPAQPRLPANREPRNAAVARRRRAAQFRHGRHPRLVDRARPVRGVVPDHWNRDAVLQQRGDLFVSAILREQRARRRRRTGTDSQRACARRCADVPGLPTGVGFCFYIRRELIDAIGVFDPAFGPGYGEENDFCMRALAAGYRSVLCDDAYVLHLGGRSFEGQKPELGARNLALLLDRHPRYAKIVEASSPAIRCGRCATRRSRNCGC